MVVKKKVSLDGGKGAGGGSPGGFPGAGISGARRTGGDLSASTEVLELFFNTGIVFHEVVTGGGLPDTVSSFVIMKGPDGADTKAVRRAQPGEEPDVEISATDHLAELSARWFPIPYQLSHAFAVQGYLGEGPSGTRLLLAIDTLERPGSQGRSLDAALDEGRPFRALDRTENGAFFDHAETREYIRRLERAGVERALFKLAALLEAVAPLLPKILLRKVVPHEAIPVSLVLDFGNSRSSALLVESRERGPQAVPLSIRNFADPFQTSDENFDSRVTFHPAVFDKAFQAACVQDGFMSPSVARLGKEALDRALETPHRYACTLSSPKRYLWDGRATNEKWHFAHREDGQYRPVSGRVLKYIPEESGGVELRADGPSAPADPRYAPRTMMLFAIAEILFQAVSQVNALPYRVYQGKEGNPRWIKHVVLTYPSAMPEEERGVYDVLVRNAVILVTHLLAIPPERRPNLTVDPATNNGVYGPFLFADEALSAQMVYLYQEVSQTFAGSMEELVGVYGKKDGTVRIASVDVGGGTTDVMIAEYADRLPGTGTALSIKKLFQDGVSIAGDEVCRAIVEDIVFPQVADQLPTAQSRARFTHLFREGDAGHGAAWETLRARLVPYFWMPLARCYWALGEGFELEGHSPEKMLLTGDVLDSFGVTLGSSVVLEDANRFLSSVVPEFPGLMNLFFKFDVRDVERAASRVLREPLRRYADILAQYDVDLLVLAGRTSALACVQNLFVAEMPVSRPRIKCMGSFRVGEWYPSRWKENGRIKDPKSTVAAGCAILHLASRNRIPGFLIDSITEPVHAPIYGLYQDTEPHITRTNELFPTGSTSQPFVYTTGMRIGFRSVDSEEMDGSPLYEVRPRDADVEAALLEDRVALTFVKLPRGRIDISRVQSQRGEYQFEPTDFRLALKTVTFDRYWLDTGVFQIAAR